jgi:hypothetical protein
MNLTNEEHEHLRKLEEELWREETRFDRQRMDQVIAEDFFEFGMSGRFYRREDTLAIPRQPIDAVFPLPNFQARLLAPDVAQCYLEQHGHERWSCLPRSLKFHMVAHGGWLEAAFSSRYSVQIGVNKGSQLYL